MASSRVGTSTSAAIPGELRRRSFSSTGIRNARVLPVPVCAVASTSLPSRACGIAAAWTGVGVKKRADDSRSFTYVEIGSSEKICILLSCWRNRGAHGISGERRDSMASLFLNYAENIRRRLRADFLRSGLEPEGPHNTTAVLSAGGVYHRWKESARRKVNVHGDSKREWLQALFLLRGAILLFAQRWIALFLESSCICLSTLSGSRRLLIAALESWRKCSGSLRFCNSR